MTYLLFIDPMLLKSACYYNRSSANYNSNQPPFQHQHCGLEPLSIKVMADFLL
jgi:hypothetical protein